MSEASYMFQKQQSPADTVKLLSPKLLKYPAGKILTAARLYEVYDPVKIQEILECFTPSNSIIILQSKSVDEECSEEDPWYGGKYSRS